MRIGDYIKENYPNKSVVNNHFITNITDFDKDVKEGSVFCFLGGEKLLNYLDNAVSLGAKSIIYNKLLKIKKKKGINYIPVSSPLVDMAKLLKANMHEFEKIPIFIGISGTSGKTSVSYLVYCFLKYLNFDCLYVGTHFIYRYYALKEEVITTKNTTISLSFLHKELLAKNYDYDYCIMEVSSQGIMEHRTLGLEFDLISITNISPEHLDYHHTLDEYRIVKGTLLNHLNGNSKYKKIILNADDALSKYFEEITINDCVKFGFNEEIMKVKNLNYRIDGTDFDLYINKKYHISTNLVGKFNVYNILNAIQIINSLKLDIDYFINYLNCFEIKILGRMNAYKYKDSFIIIDYAHTPKEVENVLSFASRYKDDKKIITIIGCGGNRDRTKRPKIGMLATKYSDHVIFTNDNPRDEEPYVIVNEIIKGVVNSNYEVILDRNEAIDKGLSLNYKKIILILGKGSEKEIILKNDKRISFSDIDKIEEIINE